MPRPRSSSKNNNISANLGFESRGRETWLSADKLRSNMDAAGEQPKKRSVTSLACT